MKVMDKIQIGCVLGSAVFALFTWACILWVLLSDCEAAAPYLGASFLTSLTLLFVSAWIDVFREPQGHE